MNRYWGHLILFSMILMVATAQLVYFYPQLPGRVATHFNGQGMPDDWAGKPNFLMLQTGLMLLIAASFGGICLILPLIPDSLINVPHKKFWLAPLMRDFTIEVIRGFLLWFGNLTLALMVAIMYLVIRANLVEEPRLSNAFWIVLGVYLLGILGLSGRMLFIFRRPKGQ